MKPSLHVNCKKATEMVEQQGILNLSFLEKLTLKFHLTICKACRSYQKQSESIDFFFKQNSVSPVAKEEQEESNILKNNIINHLNNL